MSKRTGIMLPTLFTEKLFNKLPKPVLVQAKIEGDRMRADLRGEARLLSSGGKDRISVPHIYTELCRPEFSGIEFDGELYCHGLRHSEIRSIVSRTKSLHQDYKKIKYYIYDIIASDQQRDRDTYLAKVFRNHKFEYLTHVVARPVSTLKEMQYYYDMFLEQGYEGIIIRHPYRGYVRKKVSTMLKLKPRVSESFVITEVVEEVSLKGVKKGTFGSFTCVTPEGEIFSVGSGVTKHHRKMLWYYRKELVGRSVKIRFQDYTRVRKVPKMQSIDKEWLQELEKHIETL